MEYVWMMHPDVGTPVEVPAASVAYYQSKGWYTVAGPGNMPAADVPVFISPDAPELVLTVPGFHIQTGLGSDGQGITFWIEDGTD